MAQKKKKLSAAAERWLRLNKKHLGKTPTGREGFVTYSWNAKKTLPILAELVAAKKISAFHHHNRQIRVTAYSNEPGQIRATANPTDREKITKIQLDRDMDVQGGETLVQRGKVTDLVRAASNPLTPKQEDAELRRFMKEIQAREGLRKGKKLRRNPGKTKKQLVQEAGILGARSYGKGPMAAANDPAFMKWAVKNGDTIGTAMGSLLPYLKAYNAARNAAHHKASDARLKKSDPELYAEIVKARKQSRKTKRNPTLRAKAKRAWTSAKAAFSAGYDPKWSGAAPVSFSYPIPFQFFGGSWYQGIDLSSYEKDPWGKTHKKLVRALGQPSLGDVDRDGVYQQESDDGTYTYWDIDRNVNYYYLQWDDGLSAIINFSLDGSEPETLEGFWMIRTDSEEKSEEVLKRMRKLFRATAPQKKTKRKKAAAHFKRSKANLKKKKGATKKAKTGAKRGKTPLKRKTRKNCL